MKMIDSIRNILSKYDFNKGELILQNSDECLDFEEVYINQNETEAYIVIEKQDLFTDEDIEAYHAELLWFLNSYNKNNVLRYNINLILALPFNTDNLSIVSKYERNKHICRKIFFDSNLSDASDIERKLLMLPFVKIPYFEKLSDFSRLHASIADIITDTELMVELQKDTADRYKIIEYL